MYSKILIATDGSELADRAVTHGLSLADALLWNQRLKASLSR